MTGHQMQITEQTRSQILTDMSITQAGITEQQVTETGKRMYQEQTLISNMEYRSTERIPYVSADTDMQLNRYREHMYCERTLIPNMGYRSTRTDTVCLCGTEAGKHMYQERTLIPSMEYRSSE